MAERMQRMHVSRKPSLGYLRDGEWECRVILREPWRLKDLLYAKLLRKNKWFQIVAGH